MARRCLRYFFFFDSQITGSRVLATARKLLAEFVKPGIHFPQMYSSPQYTNLQPSFKTLIIFEQQKHCKWPSWGSGKRVLFEKRKFTSSNGMTKSAQFNNGRVRMRIAVCLNCSGSLSIPTVWMPAPKGPMMSPKAPLPVTRTVLPSRQILYRQKLINQNSLMKNDPSIFINKKWSTKIH